MKTRKIFRTGNSIVLALPSGYLEMMNLKAGDFVYISAVDTDELRIRKARLNKEGIYLKPYKEVADA